MNTIVIAVDGCSKTNDRSSEDTRGSFGVFIGPGSTRNSWGCLTGEYQTNSHAELEAVKQGLATIHRMYHVGDLGDFNYRELMIKTDSEYVHNTFSDWIWNYVKNGFRRKNGKPAEHSELISEIHTMICEMEGPMNMAVRFWKVPRKLNMEADRLANKAFCMEVGHSESDSD